MDSRKKMTREEIMALDPRELTRLVGAKTGDRLDLMCVKITRWLVLELTNEHDEPNHAIL